MTRYWAPKLHSELACACLHVRAQRLHVLSLRWQVTQQLLNGAAAVRRELRSKLGTDLTTSCETNPFWHTGNAVKPSQTREHMPWDDVRRVAEGRRAGKGRSHPEAWNTYVQRALRDHVFPY